MKHGTSAQLKEALIQSGDYDEQFCDEACLQRYLRARNMDVTKAHAMLKATLEWRKESKIDTLDRSEFTDCKYLRDGWVYVDGNDAEGRTIVMFRKRRDKIPLNESEQYLRYMTFVLETAIKKMQNGQETWIWVLDLAAYAPSNAPHLSITLGVLNMLANHYPERLYKAYVVNAPSIFQVAYKVIYPFIDHVTRTKVEFVNTKDYHAPSKSDHSSSTWGSWASNMFHSKSSGSSSKAVAIKASSSSNFKDDHHDAAVVVDDGHTCDAVVTKGPGTFAPLLPMFERPFDWDRQQQVLTAAGW